MKSWAKENVGYEALITDSGMIYIYDQNLKRDYMWDLD